MYGLLGKGEPILQGMAASSTDSHCRTIKNDKNCFPNTSSWYFKLCTACLHPVLQVFIEKTLISVMLEFRVFSALSLLLQHHNKR